MFYIGISIVLFKEWNPVNKCLMVLSCESIAREIVEVTILNFMHIVCGWRHTGWIRKVQGDFVSVTHVKS